MTSSVVSSLYESDAEERSPIALGRRTRGHRIVSSLTVACAALVLAAALVAPAQAQLSGSHTLGDFGVLAGTQPKPGLYGAFFYYHYAADELRNGDGKTTVLPGSPDISLNGYAPMVWYVSDLKALGAHVGFLAVVPWANGSVEAPTLGAGVATGTKFSDILLRPIDLGWHFPTADVTAGFQLYAPTGSYESGAVNNTGKGMWSYEPFAGGTYYFDEKKAVSLSSNAYWEIHGPKKDSNVTVGQTLTLEGGGGRSFMGGGVVVGAAYYAQWKMTTDKLGTFTLPGGGTLQPELTDRHRIFAFGPDLTLPVASKTRLFALVNVRYLWETGARAKSEGSTLTVTATAPLPSVTLP